MQTDQEASTDTAAPERLDPGQKVGIILLGTFMFLLAAFLLVDMIGAFFR